MQSDVFCRLVPVSGDSYPLLPLDGRGFSQQELCHLLKSRHLRKLVGHVGSGRQKIIAFTTNDKKQRKGVNIAATIALQSLKAVTKNEYVYGDCVICEEKFATKIL